GAALPLAATSARVCRTHVRHLPAAAAPPVPLSAQPPLGASGRQWSTHGDHGALPRMARPRLDPQRHLSGELLMHVDRSAITRKHESKHEYYEDPLDEDAHPAGWRGGFGRNGLDKRSASNSSVRR